MASSRVTLRWAAVAAVVLSCLGCTGRSDKLPPEAEYASLEESNTQTPAQSAPPLAPRGPQSSATQTTLKASNAKEPGVSLDRRDCIKVANSAKMLDLNRDFTIEIWLEAREIPECIAGDAAWSAMPEASARRARGWRLRGAKDGGGFCWEFAAAAADGVPIVLKSKELPRDSGGWPVHVAVCRAGSVLRLFLEGKPVGELTLTKELAASAEQVCLGVVPDAPPDQATRADIHSFRISSSARYSAGFSPARLESDGETLVLLDFSTGHAEDLSGHGRHGQFYDTQWRLINSLAKKFEWLKGQVEQEEYLSHANLRDAFLSLVAAQNVTPKFEDYVEELYEQFPLMEPTTGEGELKWTTITLNESGDQLDGVRFKSPVRGSADLRCAIVAPPNTLKSCEILAVGDFRLSRFGHQSFLGELCVNAPNLEEPEVNLTLFKAHENGEIRGGEEYVIWFAFEHRKPVTVSVAVKLLPQAAVPVVPGTPEQIAGEMGFPLPLKLRDLSTPDALAGRAGVMLVRGDAEAAAMIADSGLEQDAKHRELLWFAIRARGTQATQSLRRGDEQAAAPLLIRAGEHARVFRDSHSPLEPLERDQVAFSLSRAASGHALQGDSEKAIASLAEAVKSGFTNVVRLEGDPSLASLHDQPGFQAVLNDLRDVLGPSVGIDYELQAHPTDAVRHPIHNDNHWYKYFPGPVSWDEARAKCQEMGGYLMCAETFDEDDVLLELAPQGHVWMGGVKTKHNDWVWITGGSVPYPRWQENPPIDLSNSGDRIKMGGDRRWRPAAADDGENRGFLCEWEF